MTKCYVSVLVGVDECGKKIPKEIIFHDHKYEVVKVLEVRNCASLKVGGIGERYKVRINNKDTHLFFETDTGRWFVESKN